jgi:hypothetical protein
MDTNITHIRGDTFSRSIQFSGTTGPIDITGSVIRFSVKKRETDSSPIIQEILNISDPTQGIVQCIVPASVMKTLDPGSYIYDMEWTDSNGNVKTVMRGNLTIIYDVTE